MGGRDHSCEVCGRGGFNDPDGDCECGGSMTDERCPHGCHDGVIVQTTVYDEDIGERDTMIKTWCPLHGPVAEVTQAELREQDWGANDDLRQRLLADGGEGEEAFVSEIERLRNERANLRSELTRLRERVESLESLLGKALAFIPPPHPRFQGPGAPLMTQVIHALDRPPVADGGEGEAIDKPCPACGGYPRPAVSGLVRHTEAELTALRERVRQVALRITAESSQPGMGWIYDELAAALNPDTQLTEEAV